MQLEGCGIQNVGTGDEQLSIEGGRGGKDIQQFPGGFEPLTCGGVQKEEEAVLVIRADDVFSIGAERQAVVISAETVGFEK